MLDNAQTLAARLSGSFDLETQRRLIEAAGLFHKRWYLTTYPDVAAAGMDPVTHYLLYGAALDRRPMQWFDTASYRARHPALSATALNPLVDYILRGRDNGEIWPAPPQDARQKIDTLRSKLLMFGFVEEPLRALEEHASAGEGPELRALAERELGLWAMRQRDAAGYAAALAHFARARAQTADHDMRLNLALTEILCLTQRGQAAQGRAAYEAAALRGEASADVMLARGSLEDTPEARLVWINRVLARGDAAPLALLPDNGQPAYDRLTAAEPLPARTGGPRVSVLVAAYQSGEMLATSLRALQEQTWRNLEVIVVDDCSPDPETHAVARRFAERDPRFRAVRLERNGGAYVARNHALDLATGDFVTLHDADDWSHPQKIEAQLDHMAEHPWLIGSLSTQARALEDLTFSRWTGTGVLINANISSFLWRREVVRETLGYWDTVRFSADTELIRRVRKVFGARAIDEIARGPMSFQRDSATSIITDDVMGMNGFYFGARREYVDSQRFHHRRTRDLRYGNDPAQRPFPAPPLMQPDRRRLTAGRHFALILRGDFRVHDAALDALIARLQRLRAGGQRVGLLEAPVYQHPTHDRLREMHPRLRREIDGDLIQVIVYGDSVSCDALEPFGRDDLTIDTRYHPAIQIRDTG